MYEPQRKKRKSKEEKNLLDFKLYSGNAEFYFKTGIKYAEKNQFDKALKFLNESLSIEPDRAEYHFNIAYIYSLMKEPEIANNILMYILNELDPTVIECYFVLGCNYFELEDMKKSKQFLEKYIEFEPYGQYAEECFELLNYLEEKFLDAKKSKKKRATYNVKTKGLLEEGRKLAKRGFFKGACKKLSLAAESEPENSEILNELTILYFLAGDFKKSINTNSIIQKTDVDNIKSKLNTLFINLLMDNNDEFEKNYIKSVKELVKNIHEFFEQMNLYGNYDMHSNIVKLMMTFLKFGAVHKYLHVLYQALYNVKDYEHAYEVLNMAKKTFSEENEIHNYYDKLFKTCNNVDFIHKTLKYGYRTTVKKVVKLKNNRKNEEKE